MDKISFLFIIIIGSFVVIPSADAQTPDLPPGPIYVVQEGDTLWDISRLFNVSIDDLISYNNIVGESIFIGDQLVIPGMENLEGKLVIQAIPLGETFRSLIHQHNIDKTTLTSLNRIVSPGELYAGYKLILLQQEIQSTTKGRASLNPNETFLELAVRHNTQIWSFVKMNNLDHTSTTLPGDVLYITGSESTTLPAGFPDPIIEASLSPLPLSQGQTAQVKILAKDKTLISGTLADYSLNFFLYENYWIALQGIHAMLEPGLYPFSLTTTSADGTSQSFEQLIIIEDGFFPRDPILQVEPSTIDPSVTVPEEEFIRSLTNHATIDKYWQGEFTLPVAIPYYIVSHYGNRRSYNNSNYIYFHTGLDFSVYSDAHPFDIYAPANGLVIYTGSLAVRGNATIIDHGWGIYSGLYHQQEIFLQIGDPVNAGELIGKIGDTGRVTGPHLHWEIWVNGVQVNPTQWLEAGYPHE